MEYDVINAMKKSKKAGILLGSLKEAEKSIQRKFTERELDALMSFFLLRFYCLFYVICYFVCGENNGTNP